MRQLAGCGGQWQRNVAAPSPAAELLSIALDTTADVVTHGARPTVGFRALAIAMTAMYGAWAAYDPLAVGTALGADLRRPRRERTRVNRETAMAFATYRALLDVYPDQSTALLTGMRARGFNPKD